jgi:hypothetical protein
MDKTHIVAVVQIRCFFKVKHIEFLIEESKVVFFKKK